MSAVRAHLRAAKLTQLGNPAFNQSPPQYERTLVPRSSPVCGGGKLNEDQYNTGLHVAALFIVLAQSTFGMFAASVCLCGAVRAWF